MSKIHSLRPVNNEKIFSPDSEFCRQCLFKDNIGTVKAECLMNSIKNQWQTSKVVHYCDDPYAYSYIKFWNSRFENNPLSVAFAGKKK